MARKLRVQRVLVFTKQPVGRVAEEGWDGGRGRGCHGRSEHGILPRPWERVIGMGMCHVPSRMQGVAAVVRRGLSAPSSTLGLSGGDFLKRKEKSYLKEEYS